MPAFSFERISPPVRRGPIAPSAKRRRGFIFSLVSCFAKLRGSDAARRQHGTTAQDEQRSLR
jgi:hypothetical protein